MFVNLVDMRKCMARAHNAHPAILDKRNLAILQRANVLFHSAYNRALMVVGAV